MLVSRVICTLSSSSFLTDLVIDPPSKRSEDVSIPQGRRNNHGMIVRSFIIRYVARNYEKWSVFQSEIASRWYLGLNRLYHSIAPARPDSSLRFQSTIFVVIARYKRSRKRVTLDECGQKREPLNTPGTCNASDYHISQLGVSRYPHFSIACT